MSGLILDGKSLAKKLEQELSLRVQELKTTYGKAPVLATILVGTEPSSVTYVRMKTNACHRVGIECCKLFLPETTTTDEMLQHIDTLNVRMDIHGILIQHPLPAHINERWCFERINILKDVDGMTSQGFGRMAMREPAYGAATPGGIMSLLAHYGISLAGKRAVVVGRGPILGKPVAMMLLNADATVTICHSKTQGLIEIIKEADIVVGAVGKPNFIKGEWIKDGAIVIDAGYNKGQIGDIEISSVIDRCAAYTPVPGGVGPMTIVTLLTHTVEAAEKSFLCHR